MIAVIFEVMPHAERRQAYLDHAAALRPLLLAATLLFYAGCAFTYYLMLPVMFAYLTSTTPTGVAMMTDIGRYLDFVLVMFLGIASFWSGYEQAGSSLNLYTDRYVDRGGVPASIFQSINPIYIILLAPLFAMLWSWLGRRGLEPSAPAKFGLALLQVGAGFLVFVLGAATGDMTPVIFVFLIYLLHTTGELCLSPVGLSNVTKLSPPRYVGQMMGTWFLGAAVGNLAAGLIGGHVGSGSVDDMPNQFLQMALIGGGAGIAVLLFSGVIKKMMGSAAQ